MNLSTSKTGSSSCQCTTTFAWGEKGNTERFEYNSQTVAEYPRQFPRWHWSFLDPGSEKKWYGTYTDKPDGSWDRMAEEMMLNFSDSDHLMFRAFSAFERGELRSKGGRKKSTTHFNGSDENIELLLSREISAIQLSVYGAIADLCNELPKVFRGSGETCSTWSFGNDGDSYSPFCWRDSDQWTATEKPGARIRAEIRAIVRRPEIIQTMFWCGSGACRKRTILLYSLDRRWTTDATFMPRIHDASRWEGDSYKRMDSQECENRSSLEHKKFAIMMIDTVSKFKFHLCLKKLLFLGLESWVVLIHTWQNRC